MADTVKGLTIQFGGDVQPLNQALEQASKRTGQFGEQLVELNKKLKLDPKNVDLLTKKQKVLGEAIKSSESMVQDFKVAYDQALNGRENGTVTEEELEAVKRGLDNAEAGLNNYKEELQYTNEALDRLSTESEEAEEDLEDLGEEAEETAESMGDIESAIGNILTEGTKIVGLVGAFGALATKAADFMDTGKIDFLGNSYSDLKKRIDETLESSEELRKSYETGKKETEENAILIDLQAKNVQKLNDQLKNEIQAGKNNTTTRKRLQQQVDLLNASLGESYLTLNKETGELEQSADALKKKAESAKAYALMQYELENMQNLWVKEYELQQQLAEINEQIETGERGIGTSLEYKRHQIELELEAIQNQTTSAEENYQKQAEAYQSYEETFSNTNSYILEQMEARRTKAKEIEKEIYETQVSYNAQRVEDATETEEKIKANTEVSLEDRIQNMRDNQKAIEDYETNIQTLIDHAMSIQDEHERERWLLTIQSLQERNAKTMGTAQQLVEDLAETGGKAAEEYVDAFNDGLENGHMDRVFMDAMGRIVTLSSQYGERIKKNLTITFSASGQVTGTSRGSVKVTAFAQGGIVTRPTNAIVGEAGPEAIVPLDRLGDIIRSALSDNRPTGGTYSLNVYPQSMSAGEQDRLFRQFDQMLGSSTSRRDI